jgi:TonB family protein
MAQHPTAVRRVRRGTGIGLGLTLALHVGVLAAVGIAHSRPQPARVTTPRTYVAAELVKLGDPAGTADRSAEVAATVDDGATVVTRKDPLRPVDREITRPRERPIDRIGRLIAEGEGPERGAAGGDSLGLADKAVGDAYLATLKGLLTRSYKLPPGIAPDQIATPPEVQVRIAADGTLFDIALLSSSDNDFVDDACVQAVRATGSVPPPPPGIRGARIECGR